MTDGQFLFFTIFVPAALAVVLFEWAWSRYQAQRPLRRWAREVERRERRIHREPTPVEDYREWLRTYGAGPHPRG